MIGQTIGTPLPGAKNKRVMIAILVSLLFHAGVAGGASVAYWLYKEPSMLDGAAFSLSIQAPDQNMQLIFEVPVYSASGDFCFASDIIQ